MLDSLGRQSAQPIEMIVVDASCDDDTERASREPVAGLATAIHYRRTQDGGAAAQRNQALTVACQPFVAFFDDDILFEPDCLSRLWDALRSDPALGGVNAMIVNQRYDPPGRITRALFRCLHGRRLANYAGLCLGPGLNLLPEDRPELPEVVPVQWLNTTCALYRREALPEPLFPAHFTGYSMYEDLALSLVVGRRWPLANARTARIYHDSQSGSHKSDIAVLSEMELVNRHYVMTQVLGRRGRRDYARLALLQLFGVASLLRSPRSWRTMPAVLRGKVRGLARILGWRP
jgi:GT2 family glycosyltransferase